MKLSEAIRLGALLHPQLFGAFNLIERETGHILRTCAIGAASAAGYDTTRLGNSSVTQCPACQLRGGVAGIIAHLNDDHRWTRERIADWVEMCEGSLVGLEDIANHEDRRREVSLIAAP
jgi:hypothetical protein